MFSLIIAILLIAAVVFLLDLTPDRVTNDIMRILSPTRSLDDLSKIAKGRKKSRKLVTMLTNMRSALVNTGKGGTFAMVCALSLLLFVAGGVFSIVIGNIFLLPIMSIALALIPFGYASTILSYYKSHLDEELETALSIITTSYVRNDSIVTAVSENISYIKPPVSEVFKSFVTETTAINANVKSALRRLKDSVDNYIFREWCETLIACQDDRTLKDTLMSVVNKLSDIRIVNNELKTLLYEPKREYWTMVGLLVGNIPLLFVLNRDWFDTLMHTMPGKIVLAMTGLVILLTALLVRVYTRKIEFKI